VDEEHKKFLNKKQNNRIDGIVQICPGQVFGEESLIK
jgi:hypothetical protein